MERATRRSGKRHGSLLGSGLALMFLLGSGVAEASSDGWLLNEEDGSPAQVEEVLAGADAMLQPEAERPLRGVDRPYVGPEPVVRPYPELDVPHPPWRYDTEYFFGLSRGLFKEEVPAGVKVVSLVGTVPLDLVGLPFAAMGGFFGS